MELPQLEGASEGGRTQGCVSELIGIDQGCAAWSGHIVSPNCAGVGAECRYLSQDQISYVPQDLPGLLQGGQHWQ